MRIHSSANSGTSLRQKPQTCPNSRGASQLQWQHYKPRGQNVWESPEGIQGGACVWEQCRHVQTRAVHHRIIQKKRLATRSCNISSSTALDFFSRSSVNLGDFKNPEKSVQLVWLLLPALRCPHGVLWDKLLQSTQLAVFDQCRAVVKNALLTMEEGIENDRVDELGWAT